jgi:hypothetical protein
MLIIGRERWIVEVAGCMRGHGRRDRMRKRFKGIQVVNIRKNERGRNTLKGIIGIMSL